MSGTLTPSTFVAGTSGVRIPAGGIHAGGTSAAPYGTSVFKPAAITIFVSKKAKTAKDVFDRNAPAADIPTAASAALRFLQAKKRKTV